MALSRLAEEFAAQIKAQDWGDAHTRLDRAGHQRTDDRGWEDRTYLTDQQADCVRTNVMWVTARVLMAQDPNLNPYEFAEACGVRTRTKAGRLDGYITAGLGMYGGMWDKTGPHGSSV